MSEASRPVDLIPFGPQYRASGVLLHITSLSSPYGIGDVGPTALAMVDRLKAAGQGWWQALPLGPTGYGNSPYQSLSSFAGNGLLISPDGLIEEGLLRASDCDEGRSFARNAVDYKAVIPFKHKLFEMAWTRFSAKPRSALRLEYDEFCVEQAHWLDDYALFRALKITHGDVCYLEWPEELVQREPTALAQARRDPAGKSDEVAWELIHLAWSSPAGLAIAPLQDLLNLGEEARMNLPGSTEGNWRWRCTDEMLSELVFERLYELTTTTNRSRP